MKTECKLPTTEKADVLEFMKARCVSIVLKFILQAIMMSVMGKAKQTGGSKLEEQLYCQFVEDFLNMCLLKDKNMDYPHLVHLSCLPTLMHGSFIHQ